MIVREEWTEDGHGDWVEDEYGHWVTDELWSRYKAAQEGLSAIEQEMESCLEVDIRTPRFFTQQQLDDIADGFFFPTFSPFRNAIPRREITEASSVLSSGLVPYDLISPRGKP